MIKLTTEELLMVKEVGDKFNKLSKKLQLHFIDKLIETLDGRANNKITTKTNRVVRGKNTKSTKPTKL